jgi:hypothetical protein
MLLLAMARTLIFEIRRSCRQDDGASVCRNIPDQFGVVSLESLVTEG